MTDESIDDLETVVRYIARKYRRCKMNIDIREITGVKEAKGLYDIDIGYVGLINCVLSGCSRETRLIITEGYLKDSDPKWYLEYWSRTTYYRKKREAIKEFLIVLNSVK